MPKMDILPHKESEITLLNVRNPKVPSPASAEILKLFEKVPVGEVAHDNVPVEKVLKAPLVASKYISEAFVVKTNENILLEVPDRELLNMNISVKDR